VSNYIQSLENFSFGAFLQFKQRNCGCCYKKNPKHQLFLNAREAVARETDIVNIVKKIRLA